MEDFFNTITPYIVSFAVDLVLAIIILFVGFKLAKLAVKLFLKSHVFAKLDPSVSTFIKSFLSIAIKVLVIVTVAGVIGIPMTSFITILGSMAVAIGLSIQGSLSNIAGGLLILMTKPFGINDYIVSNGYEGVVTDIGLFYTKLNTVENRKVVIPNSVVTSNVLVNVTEQKTRRVDLEISVAYESDVDKVRAILENIANNHPKVLKQPEAPLARVANHGESSLVFAFRTWCNKEDYWEVRFDLLESVKAEFDKEGINIPYNQLDVHLYK